MAACLEANDRRQVTLHEIAKALDIGMATLDQIVHEHLHTSKVCARWMPKIVMPEMKKNRVRYFDKNLFLMLANCRDQFRRRGVTRDESWIYHCIIRQIEAALLYARCQHNPLCALSSCLQVKHILVNETRKPCCRRELLRDARHFHRKFAPNPQATQ